MEPASNATVYIVDDDAEVREALAWLLRSRRVLSEAFASAEAFETMLAERTASGLMQRQPCCLLLDVRMPGGMSGLALFDKMVERGDTAGMPVIFLTGHADVPTAVATVKRGAFDFCEKPFSDNQLVDRIQAALELSARHIEACRARHELQDRLADLTDRERDVMRLVVEGLPNKLIADQLDISVRTVEVHRARVFDKMQVKSAVELANLLRAAPPA
ncbi:MAG: response regulator [Diaphorobacter nitroreducens]|uniref:response regulator transcription factor n=1 Tax=Diaphorobacter TaxID=238749 RepID=UPI0000DC94A3|nr:MULTISPECIES: response regulator [Diaphorobacter]ABM44119.1 response regulator receiver protein [Acidovorax sp. JS42]TFI46810.1 response regulator transcription factor [Diaphorobacter sp. DS2]UOB05395.1 response regulator [Diaphorobacter sp. LI3]ASI69835.1 DNA-binding response regulator [Diaphorobacter nitroreducens]POR09876.1 DNA-binding response regulator [Diaphorobacter sp. LR2014-1]